METFSRYWSFVRGIHRWSVDSPHKDQWRRALVFSLIFAWKKSRRRWFETPSRSLWHHCNVRRYFTPAWWIRDGPGSYVRCMIYMYSKTNVKPASNDFGCICEEIWKDQCSMEVYITINRTKWCCSKLLIKLVVATKTFFTFVMLLKWAAVIVRRAGLLWSQQDFEWRWSVPLFKCLTVLEFSFILFDLCLLITFFNFIMNYVPIVTFWIFTYHKIWVLSIMFCSIWSYWIIYFLACLEVSWRVVS